MDIKYTVLDPCKNITVLVETPVQEQDRCFVASKIMEIEKDAEQVGFLQSNILDMAGGEFCGNACRCAAVLSGFSTIICAGQEIKCEGTAAYIPKTLSGITHYIYEEEIENPEDKARELSNGEAVGLMFFDEKAMSLRPLVFVPSANTMVWENSCVSGTAALAEYLLEKYKKDIDIDIKEPGGVLNIKSTLDSEFVRIDGDVVVSKKGSICIPELNY